MRSKPNEIQHGYCHCGCGEETTPAKRTYSQRGIFKGQPMRYLPGHGARKFNGEDYVVDANGCWVWVKSLSPSGYGRTNIDGKQVYAHRVYYERENGAIPEGLELDHLCRNRKCVNPKHLEPVTSAENCRRGMMTKLTKADVAEIRRLHSSGVSQYRIARNFNLSGSHVCRIVNFIKWRS